jgi:hypothetical protein
MQTTINIPQDLQKSFTRLIDLIPLPYRNEMQIQEDILLFLKLEGEQFVRDEIERTKEIFFEKFGGNALTTRDQK